MPQNDPRINRVTDPFPEPKSWSSHRRQYSQRGTTENTVNYFQKMPLDNQISEIAEERMELGTELYVNEEMFLDMATVVSGTGPTYAFLVMETMIDAAVHLGFPRHLAHQ
jgi:4-diphosphocytidyl-2C-methyl-D-erythritol kinase